MNNKGIGMIVVWIFIILAGSMILLIFIMIANDQLTLGKEKLELQALSQVTSIIATQQATGGTFARIPIPAEEIKLRCEQLSGITLSQIEMGGRTRDLGSQFVVGEDITADVLHVFTRELHLPFRIGNILFMSSERELFVIDDGKQASGDHSTSVLEFAKLLPQETPAYVGVYYNSANSGHEHLRILAVEQSEAQFTNRYSSGDHIDVWYVTTASDGDWRKQGVLHHLGNQETIPYYSEEMLLAYVWQGNIPRAQCLETKIVDRTKQVANVLMDRYALMSQRSLEIGDTVCAGIYGPAGLQAMSTATDSAGLYTVVDQVKNRNRAILGGTSCATIY